MILVVILYALFGFTFTLGKLTLDYASPFFIVGTRMIIGGLGLMGFIYFRHRLQCYPARVDRWYYQQLIIFGIIIPYCSRAWALQYISTTKAALLFCLAPFFTALWAYFFAKEKLTFLKLTGLIIGFLGMIPVLVNGSSVEDSLGTLGFLSLPELAIIVAVGALSYSLIIMQQLVKNRGCPPYLANATSMFIGGLFALNLSFLVETNLIKTQTSLKPFIILLGLQILISNIICSNLQAYLLKHYSSTFMSFASFLSPLCAALYGAVLFNEKFTWHYLVSFIIVIIGLALYYYDDIYKQRKKTHVGIADQT